MKRRIAFTLIEMTMAIAITGVTGLSVAGAAITFSTAHEHSREFYGHIQTARTAMMRVQRMIRSCLLVTSVNGTSMILWASDANEDGQINPSETILLEWDYEAGEVRLLQIAYPAGMSADVRIAIDMEMPLGTLTNDDHAKSAVFSSSYVATTVLATDVTGFYLTAKPDAPMARLVTVQMTVGEGTRAVTLRSAANTRADWTSYIGIADGNFVLTTQG